MNSFASAHILFLFVTCICVQVWFAVCENLQDVCPAAELEKQTVFINGLPCKNPTSVIASDFKTTKLSEASEVDILGAAVNIVTAAEFPGLNTLGLSIARTDLTSDGMVTIHSHPRASEIIFVDKGSVLAVFLDTKNQQFQEYLNEGDVFVFPRGLLHFLLNTDLKIATVLSVFNSQNPGVVTLAPVPSVDSLYKLKRRLIPKSTLEDQHIANLTSA